MRVFYEEMMMMTTTMAMVAKVTNDDYDNDEACWWNWQSKFYIILSAMLNGNIEREKEHDVGAITKGHILR